MNWSNEAIEAASLVGNGHDYIRRVLAAAVNVDGPVYRYKPEAVRREGFDPRDELNELLRVGVLEEVGEDSTPEANVAAVVTGFASVDAVNAFLGSEDLKAMGEDSTSLCSTCGHLHYGTGHVGTVIGEDSTP